MPTSYSVPESKRLGGAILKFLEYHQKNRRLAPDQDEGIGVAMQCLSLVFDAVPTDAKDTPDLMEIFNQACNDKGLELPKTSEPSADDKKAAEDFKKAGNVAMKEQKYQEAVDEYTKAIEKDNTSETYFCNRAAAYTNLNKYHEALDDCKRAIAINEDYAKAFSRMALIYSKLSFYEESVHCYKTAIELEPDNEGYKTNLKKVEPKAEEARKQQAEQNAMMQQQAMMGGAPGMPGMPPMGGEMPPGMMEAYQQFASNPQFAQMADSVMNNPEMKSMVDNFMQKAGIQKPEGAADAGTGHPMDGLSQAMGAGANVEELMALGQQFAAHMQKENPELIENLRNQMTGMAMGGAPGAPVQDGAAESKPKEEGN